MKNDWYNPDGTLKEPYRFCLGKCDRPTEHTEEWNGDELTVACTSCDRISHPII